MIPYLYTEENIFAGEDNQVRAFVEYNYNKSMHVQNFYEINIINRGRGLHHIGSETVAAEKGDVFIIPPMLTHGYSNGDGLDVIHVLLSSVFFDNNLSDLEKLPEFTVLFRVEPILRAKNNAPHHLRLTEKELLSISSLTDNIRAEKVGNGAISIAKKDAYATILICELCRIYKKNGVKRTSEAGISPVIKRIHESPGADLRIEELVKLSGMSRSAFIESFNLLLGVPPAQYVLKVRLDLAKRLLRETTLPISEIAIESGFYDASHLTRAFKKDNGITPAAFRKSY